MMVWSCFLGNLSWYSYTKSEQARVSILQELFCVCMAGFVTHAVEERWEWQWFYSIMAPSFGLQLSVPLGSK